MPQRSPSPSAIQSFILEAEAQASTESGVNIVEDHIGQAQAGSATEAPGPSVASPAPAAQASGLVGLAAKAFESPMSAASAPSPTSATRLGMFRVCFLSVTPAG